MMRYYPMWEVNREEREGEEGERIQLLMETRVAPGDREGGRERVRKERGYISSWRRE